MEMMQHEQSATGEYKLPVKYGEIRKKSTRIVHYSAKAGNGPSVDVVGLKQCNVLSKILFKIYINDLPGRLLDSRSSDTISDTPYLDDTKINNLL